MSDETQAPAEGASVPVPDRAEQPGQLPTRDWSAHPYLCPTASSEALPPGQEPERPGLDHRPARPPAPEGRPPAPERHPPAGQAAPPVLPALRAPTSGPRKGRRPVPHTRRRPLAVGLLTHPG
jgi:hypothetical protein